MAMLLLIAAQGWNGFTGFYLGLMPLYVFLILCGENFNVLHFLKNGLIGYYN